MQIRSPFPEVPGRQRTHHEASELVHHMLVSVTLFDADSEDAVDDSGRELLFRVRLLKRLHDRLGILFVDAVTVGILEGVEVGVHVPNLSQAPSELHSSLNAWRASLRLPLRS